MARTPCAGCAEGLLGVVDGGRLGVAIGGHGVIILWGLRQNVSDFARGATVAIGPHGYRAALRQRARSHDDDRRGPSNGDGCRRARRTVAPSVDRSAHATVWQECDRLPESDSCTSPDPERPATCVCSLSLTAFALTILFTTHNINHHPHQVGT